MTIAGFDPSGDAGIIADIRTIEALGCTAVAAITSITFQNTRVYAGALHQDVPSVRAQVEAIATEHVIAALKIGMLPTAEIVREVARLIQEFHLPKPGYVLAGALVLGMVLGFNMSPDSSTIQDANYTTTQSMIAGDEGFL